jgi:flagellar basal body-associated protein FliL
MYFLDVIAPGSPKDPNYWFTSSIKPMIIVGAVLLVVAAVLITAVLVKKNSKKKGK